jgi:hypothetical protein
MADLIWDGGPTTLESFVTLDPCDMFMYAPWSHNDKIVCGFISQNTFLNKIMNKYTVN